jgi:molybdopterin converting factor small subunit
MEVKVKLYAWLAKYRPDAEGEFPVELPEGSTVSDLMEELRIPPGSAALAIVNGSQQKKSTILQDGDEVSLFPPVGGG